MMKKTFLTAALLAGMSTFALADQRRPVEYIPPGRVDAHFARTRWQPLTQMLTTDYWFGSKVIRIGDDRDELSALRLMNGSGATYVYGMSLRYGDGHVENIPVNKWLYSGERAMSFKLAPDHELKQITLQTFSWGYSTFQVMGERSRISHPNDPPPPPPPGPIPAPVTGYPLANNVTFANTGGYMHLPVGVDKGLFSKLRIESTDYNTFIGHIHITFASGAHQTIDVNKMLSRGEVLDRDLQGDRSAITAIVLMQSHDGVVRGAGRFNVSLLR